MFDFIAEAAKLGQDACVLLKEKLEIGFGHWRSCRSRPAPQLHYTFVIAGANNLIATPSFLDPHCSRSPAGQGQRTECSSVTHRSPLRQRPCSMEPARSGPSAQTARSPEIRHADSRMAPRSLTWQWSLPWAWSRPGPSSLTAFRGTTAASSSGTRLTLQLRQPASRAEQIGVGLPELTRNRWSPQVDSAISSRASWFMTTIHPSEI